MGEDCTIHGQIVVQKHADGSAGVFICDGSSLHHIAGTGFLSDAQKLELSKGFSYTGATQRYVVPSGVERIKIHAWGAGGGTGSFVSPSNGVEYPRFGGSGAYASSEFTVSKGDKLAIVVGGGGMSGGSHGRDGIKSAFLLFFACCIFVTDLLLRTTSC